jgi:branched-chain amino acid transport system permease protein
LNFFGFYANKPIEKYPVCLVFVTVFALLAKNLGARQYRTAMDGDPRHGHRRRAHGHPAALRQAHGLRAVVLYHVGVAGSLWAFVYLGAWEPLAFNIDRSFQVLFMVIIGGLGSILGSFLGAPLSLCCRSCSIRCRTPWASRSRWRPCRSWSSLSQGP